jgi:DNA-binding SARP family transcriptional activator/tetratricopeptide (TPR) repeat protein
MQLEFRLLGPLEAFDRGHSIALGGPKPRALLAVLLLEPARVVSVDRLVDDLWGDAAPATATHAVKVYVSSLRKALGGSTIATRAPGYVLDVDPDRVDVHRFGRLLVEAATADPATAATRLREALALWRGPPLAEFAYEPFAQLEIARLEEQRLLAVEARIDADLALGHDDSLVPELEALVAAEPFRERFRCQLLLALYRSGRQADALAAYRAARETLVEELGIEPGPDLRALQQAILAHDEALSLPAGPASRPPMQFRRLVTIVFVDLVESMALADVLDPETLHRVLRRYFETASTVLERHGGTVEKFAGDAVMAAFGVPVGHEDDVLRGARAALEVQRAVAALGDRLEPDLGVRLDARVGVETGEVLSEETASRQRLVTGDAVGVAARLQQGAAPGDVVVGELSRRLLGGAGRFEPLGRLELKGKRAPVAAFRLLDLAPDAPGVARRLDAPLVGRRLELTALKSELSRVREARSLRAVTVAGDAGIGKSRLAKELVRTAKDVQTLIGRCPSYGEGITYWPLREIVGDDPGAALAGDPEAETIVARLGRLDATAPEIAWAFRRWCEVVASERPLLLVLDDLHWAEPTFLDLVEHVVDRASGPILVVGLARDELLEARPEFLEGRDNAMRLLLESLSSTEANALVDELAGGALAEDSRARIVEAAEGNPLFLEQLFALAGEGGLGRERPLPTSIRALLAARLDRLGPGERAVLERAAVVGRQFRRDELSPLLEPEAAPTAARHLQTLAARGFVRQTSDEDFRFRHGLIQEAVARAAPKELRAQLHERFADWLDHADLERDELIGYHLEQAYRLRAELGPVDRRTRKLGEDAGERLGEAGMRAWKRGDAPAAVNLLGRATELLDPRSPVRLELLCELGLAFKWIGDDQAAEGRLREALELSISSRNLRLELRAHIEQAWPRLMRGEADAASVVELVESALPVFEAEGDDRGLSRAWQLVAAIHGPLRCRHADCERAASRALESCRRTGFSAAGCLSMLAASAYYGPRPVTDALARCRSLLAEARDDRWAQALIVQFIATLEATRGRFTAARKSIQKAWQIWHEYGIEPAVDLPASAARVELLAGNLKGAEGLLRDASKRMEESGESAWVATLAAMRGEALYSQRRFGEALSASELAMRSAPGDDVFAQASWRRIRAKALAQDGRFVEAMDHAREAVALLTATDALNERGEALLDLAEVVSLAGEISDAERAVEEALVILRSKGSAALVARAEAMAADLTSVTPVQARGEPPFDGSPRIPA